MRKSDIETRIMQVEAELAERKWMREHLCQRRSELRSRNAPTSMLRRYDLDIMDAIEKVNLTNIELGELHDQLIEHYDDR